MRVLHICESFGGGVFTVVKELCNGHVKRGLSVGIAFVLREETPADFQQQLDSRVKLYDLNQGKRAGRGGLVTIDPWGDLKVMSRVVRAVFDYRPDVIHAHSSKGGFIGRLTGLLYRHTGRRVREFYSPHGFAFLREDISRAQRRWFLLLEQIGYACGGTVVGCSAGEAAIARERVGNARVTVIENGIDLSEVQVRQQGAPQAPVTVVTMGRISAQKDPHLFAAVARRLGDGSTGFRWVGGGESEGEVMLRSIPHVTVTGWLPRAEALRELSRGDIYLQTSRWEGMPLSVIEALAARLPAVVTDIIGNRDVVSHGESGFVARSEAELAERVRQLATDHELRARMGARARQLAIQRFALPRLLEDWMRVYTDGTRA